MGMEYNKRNAGGVCGAGTQTQQQTQQTRTATIFLPCSSYSHSLSVPSRIGVTGLAGVEMKSDDICFPFFSFSFVIYYRFFSSGCWSGSENEHKRIRGKENKRIRDLLVVLSVSVWWESLQVGTALSKTVGQQHRLSSLLAPGHGTRDWRERKKENKKGEMGSTHEIPRRVLLGIS